MPTRRRGLAAARFALVFAASYLLLRASWPWIESPYSRAVFVEITAAVGGMATPLDVRRIPSRNRQHLRGVDFDIEVHPSLGEQPRRRSEVWPVFISSQRASFDPTALLLALTLATPAAHRRRAYGLVVAPILLHVLIVILLAAEIRYCVFLSLHGAMNPVEYAAMVLLSYAGAQSETHAVLPALLWLAFFPDVVLGRRAMQVLRSRGTQPPSAARSNKRASEFR